MIGLDCDGFDMRVDGEITRFHFERTVTDATEARVALVALARPSRTE